mmetsp:Transcript_25547/g.37782  ORF Transcript_25547/g.37782 Transcript_25547/m.37782 type:complete len:941 (-) Transcript_25547:313-3135(-)
MASTHKSSIRNNHHRHYGTAGQSPPPPISAIEIVSKSMSMSKSNALHPNPSKKKFGKNLNKLVKQKQQQQPSAPPPIVNSSRGSSGASSGLLLLSTKGTKKSVSSSTNTHDALVSVLNGGHGNGVGSGSSDETQKGSSGVGVGQRSSTKKMNGRVFSGQDDDRDAPRGFGHVFESMNKKEEVANIVAWGKGPTSTSTATANATPTPTSTSPPLPDSLNNTRVASSKSGSNNEGQKATKRSHFEQYLDSNRFANDNNHKREPLHSERTSGIIKTSQEAPSSPPSLPPSLPSSKEESAQLNACQDKPNSTKSTQNGEDQVEFMKKLAKERAEKRRKEEEARIQAQKERAAARLKELESKMNLGKKATKMTSASEKTGFTVAAPKKLYDPSRSYSSLLGGGNGNLNGGIPLTITSTNNNSMMSSSSASERNLTLSPKTSSSESPKIQFASYDDRDRGRKSNSGPRMLFDPKSGSMIAAPSKDTAGAVSSRGRKEKKKQRSSGAKDRDTTITNEKSQNGDSKRGDSTKLSKSRNKRESGSSRKDGRKIANDEKSNNENANRSRKNHAQRGWKIPRTCGVLYRRDSKGRIVSADGCEGDRGYGAHSVPGGRVRNSKCFAMQKERVKLETKQYQNASEISYEYTSQDYATMHTHQHSSTYSTSNTDYDYDYDYENDRNLNGLNRSHFMPKNKNVKDNGITQNVLETVDADLLSPELVKGDEMLDLLTGLQDSPKLQATAAAWAPSEAVLALAAAHSKKEEGELVDSPSDSNEDAVKHFVQRKTSPTMAQKPPSVDENKVEMSPSIGLGLGFDPTKDMDNMMMTPTMGIGSNEKEVKPLDLSLSSADESSMPISASNPFATSNGLLGSTTWGTVHSTSMGSLSNWDLRGSGGGNGKNSVPNTQNEDSSNSFLSSLGNTLGNQTAWGSNGGFATGGFNGINGPSMGSS